MSNIIAYFIFVFFVGIYYLYKKGLIDALANHQ